MLDSVAGGLYFCNARYYDRVLGRFTQADTIVPEPGHPQALNRYSYVLNNPLRFIDDSGEIAIDIVGGGGGGGGAGMAGVMLASGLAQTVGQQVSALTVRMAPAANATGQTWSLTGNQIIAAGDQLSQAAQNAGQAGNTADPGGNRRWRAPQDPWYGRELTLRETRRLTDQSTVLGEERITVIGRLAPRSGAPGYQAVGQRMNASYLRMDEALYNRLTPEQFNQVNGQFLRDALARGDRIYLGTELGERVGQLAWELDFLAREFGLVLGADGFLVPK